MAIRLNAKVRPSLNQSNVLEIEYKSWQVEQLKQLDINKDYVIEIKQVKDKRSLEQNNLMWELISRINKKTNGFMADKDSEEAIYCHLVEMAQVKRDYIAGLPEIEGSLKSIYRVVKKGNRTIMTDKGKELITFICYKGSSKFNTKEMTDFIEHLLNYASQNGVDVSEFS